MSNLSCRNIFNLGFAAGFDDHLINKFRYAEQFGMDNGGSWKTGAPFNKIVGPNGYPNVYDPRVFGGGIRLVSHTLYPGQWVLRWKGKAEVRLNATATLLREAPELADSSNVEAGGDALSFKTIDGDVITRVVFRYIGETVILPLQVVDNDIDRDGHFIEGIEVYRIEDEAHYLAGNKFRIPYKQMIVDNCPGAIRAMDWHGGNISRLTRFDTTRAKPDYAAYASNDWCASPPYDAADYTTANQFTVPAVTTGDRQTPDAEMPLQGEVVTGRFDKGIARGGVRFPGAITAANPGVVTSYNHGLASGDRMTSMIAAGEGVGNLNVYPSVIAVIDDDHYSLDIDTSEMPAFTPIAALSGSVVEGGTTITGLSDTSMIPIENRCGVTGPGIPPGAYVWSKTANSVTLSDSLVALSDETDVTFYFTSTRQTQFVTHNVGGRGAYPLVFEDGHTPAAFYGSGYLAEGDYKSLIFDKEMSAQTDGSGNPVMGIWMFNNVGANNAHTGGMPLEIIIALVNECNAMGPAHPINLVINVPHLGILSIDPDHTPEANYPVNMARLFKESLNRPALVFIEYSNETWNSGGTAFSQTYYLARKGFLRWGGSTNDYASMHTLRAVAAMEDIKASEYYEPDWMFFVQSGQGTLAATGLNAERMDGTSNVLNDPDYSPGPSVAPMTLFNGFFGAGYISTQGRPDFDTDNLATFADSFISHIGDPVAQERDCANYVRGCIEIELGGSETIDRYRSVFAQIAAKVITFGPGKWAGMYEGGWDKEVKPITDGIVAAGAVAYCRGISNQSTIIEGVPDSYVSAIPSVAFLVGYGIAPMTQVLSKPSSTSLEISIATTLDLDMLQFLALDKVNFFLYHVKRSQAWADAMLRLFSSFGKNSILPSEYVPIGFRWGHIAPTPYGTHNTEWTDMSKAWLQEGARNRSLADGMRRLILA